MKKITLLLIMTLCLNLNSVLAKQTKNIFTYKLNNVELNSLSEGEREGNPTIFSFITDAMLDETLPNGSFSMATNAFLVRSEGKNILIDAGYGTNLFANLQSLGVNSEQIDIILITHCHGDHIGGLLHDGKESFPNATIYMSENEYNYWMNSKNERFENVRKIITPYKNQNRVKLFTPDELNATPNMLFPNIQAIALYGHTPGHTGFMIGNDTNRIFVWSDLTHCTPVQMMFPNVSVSFDTDGAKAAEIRKKVLKYVSQNNIPIAGSHITYPSIGRIKEKDGTESYEFYRIDIDK